MYKRRFEKRAHRVRRNSTHPSKFHISGTEKREHRIFIGSDDDINVNITITKSVFFEDFREFFREKENIKYNIIDNDAEYEFVDIQSSKKNVM